MDVEKGQESPVFDAAYQSIEPIVAIAPDGKALYYTKSEPDANPAMNLLRLLHRDLDTGTETELYRAVSDGAGFFGLSISPDGRQLAFIMGSRSRQPSCR